MLTRIVFFLFYALVFSTWAQEAASNSADASKENSLDASRKWLTHSINKVSGSLDSFFVNTFFGEQITEEEVDGSTGRVAVFTRREPANGAEYRLEGRLKLDLPHTNKKVNFVFQSQDDSEYSLNKDPVQNVENASYFSALRFVLSESKRWGSDFDLGIHWDLPPDPFMRLRFKRKVKKDSFEARAVQSFYYYVLDGIGERTEFQLDNSLDDKRLVRAQASAEYWREKDYFSLDYGFGLYHAMPNDAMLAALVGASGDTDEGAVFNKYYAALKYRKKIYKNWIYAEITPQIEWNEDRNYLFMPVLLFRIEALIGPD